MIKSIFIKDLYVETTWWVFWRKSWKKVYFYLFGYVYNYQWFPLQAWKTKQIQWYFNILKPCIKVNDNLDHT